MPRISGLAAVLLSFAVTLSPALVAAETASSVDALAGQADKAIVRGDYQAALGYVDQVRALQKQGVTVPPRVFEQESRAAQALGDPVRAKAALDSYLAIASPGDPYYAEAIKLYPELQRKIAALGSAQASMKQSDDLHSCLTNANARHAERYCRSWLATAKGDDPRRADAEARISKLQADLLAEETARTAAAFETCMQAPTAAAAPRRDWRGDILQACNVFLQRASAEDPKRSAATARHAELTEAARDACLQTIPQPPDPEKSFQQLADCNRFLHNAPPQDSRRSEVERRKAELQDALLAHLHGACMEPGAELTVGTFDRMIAGCTTFLVSAAKDDPRRDEVTGQEQRLKDTLLRRLFEICTQGTVPTEEQQAICREYLKRAPRDDPRRPQVQALIQPGR